MSRNGFTEERIIGVLRGQGLGRGSRSSAGSTGYPRRRVSAWEARYGGMDVSEAKRLKAPEAENAKLRRLYGDAMLDNAGLKELLAKKW